MAAERPAGGGGLLPAFRLERFFAKHEFAGEPLLLCVSDAAPLPLRELLSTAEEDVLHQYEDSVLTYSESLGLPGLREEVAKLHGCSADSVLSCVPAEGILLAHALLRPGDHVVVIAPGYQSLFTLAQSLGCDCTPWTPSRDAAGALRFQVAALRQLVRPTTRLIVINFPHNPTGAVLTDRELAEVVAIARGCSNGGAILFSDEMYRGQLTAHATDGHRACPTAIAAYDRALVLGGLSKSYGCPGLRAGWLVTQDTAMFSQLASARDYTTICGCKPGELLSLMALRAGPRLMARVAAVCAANLPLLDAFFARHATEWEYTAPVGGTTCFPRLLTGEPADVFCERCRLGCNVVLLPSSVYDFVTPGEERVRIGFGRDDFPKVLATFERWMYS